MTQVANKLKTDDLLLASRFDSVNIYDVMISGCLETFNKKQKANEKARLERRARLDEELSRMSEMERTTQLGDACRAECEDDLARIPEPVR